MTRWHAILLLVRQAPPRKRVDAGSDCRAADIAGALWRFLILCGRNLAVEGRQDADMTPRLRLRSEARMS